MAVPIGITDALRQPPRHVREQADYHQPEQYRPEWLAEQLLNCAASVHRFPRTERRHDGKKADADVHRAPPRVTAACQPDQSTCTVHIRFRPEIKIIRYSVVIVGTRLLPVRFAPILIMHRFFSRNKNKNP